MLDFDQEEALLNRRLANAVKARERFELWSAYIALEELDKRRAESVGRKKPKVVGVSLDTVITDHAPFSGNEFNRLRNYLEQQGLNASFRDICEMSELDAHGITRRYQLGEGVKKALNTIRREDGPWMISLRHERMLLMRGMKN